jgi:hypothetical protein
VSPDLLATLNQLNAQFSFARAYWVNGFVFASVEFVAETVDPPELATGISQIATIADTYDDQLRGRFGGVLPFEPGAIPTQPLGPATTPVTDPALPPPPPGAAAPMPPTAAAAGPQVLVPAAPSIPPPPPGERPVLIG